MKNCKYCNNNFSPKHNSQKYCCIDCSKKVLRKQKNRWNSDNKEKNNLTMKIWKKNNPEKIEIYKNRHRGKYNGKYKGRYKEYNKEYEKSEKRMEYKKLWEVKNKDKRKRQRREYYDKNKDIWKKTEVDKERRNFLHREKIKKDKCFAIKCRLKCKLWIALDKYSKTGKIISSKKYGIGYKAIIEQLKPFPQDLSKYHIDHIRPLCSFNFVNEDGSTNLEEVRRAFASENHQWLLAEDNLSKNGKWEKQSKLNI